MALKEVPPDVPVKVVRCSCHGTEIMAQVVNDNLVLRKRIHGQQHILLTKVRDGCILEIVQIDKA